MDSVKNIVFFISNTCGITSQRPIDNGGNIPNSMKIERVNTMPKEFFKQCKPGHARKSFQFFNAVQNFVVKVFPQWCDVRRSTIEVKNISGNGGSSTFKVTTTEDYMPEEFKHICLHVRSVDNAGPWAEDCMMEAQKLLFEAGVGVPRYISGENWYIEPWVEGVHKCNDAKKMAEMTAKVHKLPTEWYEVYRRKIVYEVPILTMASKGSHIWPLTNKLSWYKKYKKAHKFMQIAGFEPISEAGKQVVFTHGNIHENNLLSTPEGNTYLIDFETCSVQYAANEIASIFAHDQFGCYDIKGKYEFCQAYLTAMEMPSDEKSAGEFLFDVECARLRSSSLSQLLKDVEQKRRNPFHECEDYKKFEMFEQLARENESLKSMIVDSTIEKAFGMVSKDMQELKFAVKEFDDRVDRTMETWPKELVVRLILEENPIKCCEKDCKHNNEVRTNERMRKHFQTHDQGFFIIDSNNK